MGNFAKQTVNIKEAVCQFTVSSFIITIIIAVFFNYSYESEL